MTHDDDFDRYSRQVLQDLRSIRTGIWALVGLVSGIPIILVICALMGV